MVALTPVELTCAFLICMGFAFWWGKTIGAKGAFEYHWQLLANTFCSEGDTLSAELKENEDDAPFYEITVRHPNGVKRVIS
jgi:hypothetical protein